MCAGARGDRNSLAEYRGYSSPTRVRDGPRATTVRQLTADKHELPRSPPPSCEDPIGTRELDPPTRADDRAPATAMNRFTNGSDPTSGTHPRFGRRAHTRTCRTGAQRLTPAYSPHGTARGTGPDMGPEFDPTHAPRTTAAPKGPHASPSTRRPTRSVMIPDPLLRPGLPPCRIVGSGTGRRADEEHS